MTSRSWIKKSRNAWTIISALAAVAALAIPIAIYVASRQSKALTIETISSASVADIRDPALSGLKLSYKDQPVSRVTTATIEVANTGTQPIETRDFERPLVIRFDAQTPVLAVTLSESSPSNLDPKFITESSAVTISPLLLNPSDRFRLNVVLQGDFNEPSPDARVAGISGVSRKLLTRERISSDGIVLLLIGGITLFAYGYLGPFTGAMTGQRMSVIPRADAFAIVLTLGMAASFFGIVGVRLINGSRTLISALAAVGAVLISSAVFLAMRRRRGVQLSHQIRSRGLSHDSPKKGAMGKD
jgi:hypothetical protein